MILRADLALLTAKRSGGRICRVFDTGMNNQLALRRAFKDEMLEATRSSQWRLVYQPQRSLSDGRLVGVEALLRWDHPTRGMLTPADFLSVLETHPVAYQVGCWALNEACRQLASWRAMGVDVPRVAVNLFAAQFASGSLQDSVGGALCRHALAPLDLELEITETIALRPGESMTDALNELRGAGVHIALDDFGTGFASLSTIKQLPMTRLKIDRSFVEDVCEEAHSAAIVAAMVCLAERLGLEVVAEGIETGAQRDALLGMGCLIGQGYLLGRPVAAENLLIEI